MNSEVSPTSPWQPGFTEGPRRDSTGIPSRVRKGEVHARACPPLSPPRADTRGALRG